MERNDTAKNPNTDQVCAEEPRRSAVLSPRIANMGMEAMSPVTHPLDTPISELEIANRTAQVNHDRAIECKLYDEAARLRQVGEDIEKGIKALRTVRDMQLNMPLR